jgi:hypothetical protein
MSNLIADRERAQAIADYAEARAEWDAIADGDKDGADWFAAIAAALRATEGT